MAAKRFFWATIYLGGDLWSMLCVHTTRVVVGNCGAVVLWWMWCWERWIGSILKGYSARSSIIYRGKYANERCRSNALTHMSGFLLDVFLDFHRFGALKPRQYSTRLGSSCPKWPPIAPKEHARNGVVKTCWELLMFRFELATTDRFGRHLNKIAICNYL